MGVRGVVVASRLAAMASTGSAASSSNVVGNGAVNEVATLASSASKFSSFGVVDSNSRIPSYRLTSLDRLAQRQRLFETNGAAAALAAESAAISSANNVS